MGEKDWRAYEEYICEKLKEWADGEAEVKFDQKLPGKLSGVPRQVDALVTGRFAGNVEKDVTAAVDCKRYSRKVHVKHVEAFIGLVEDVQTDLGLLITNKGFTKAAEKRARRGIRLHVVPPVYVAGIDELPRFYSAAYDEAYYAGEYFDHSPYGGVGATISYYYVDDGGYTRDPSPELDWLEEPLASGRDDELSWGSLEPRQECARIVLRHRMSRDPTQAEIDAFVEEIANEWEDGYPWTLYSGELASKLGL